MRTLVLGNSAFIVRVAARPSILGIPKSIITRSGRVFRQSATASSPSPASPTTSMSGREDSMTLIPVLNSAWSSAIKTREGNTILFYSLPNYYTLDHILRFCSGGRIPRMGYLSGLEVSLWG